MTLWYVPTAPQPTADATAIDTVNRLDQYVIWYAAREAATKDKAWDLTKQLDGRMAAFVPEIERIARLRDPGGRAIVDESQARNVRALRRWRWR